MRVLHRLKRLPVHFNMTPMIDVVFLLIIFFLVSSHLARRENRIQVDLPTARGGQQDVADPTPRLTLTLTLDGATWLGGQPVSQNDLTDRLIARIKRDGPSLELRVRCDRHVPYRKVEPLLASAARAGLWNVHFAVFEVSQVQP